MRKEFVEIDNFRNETFMATRPVLLKNIGKMRDMINKTTLTDDEKATMFWKCMIAEFGGFFRATFGRDGALLVSNGMSDAIELMTDDCIEDLKLLHDKKITQKEFNKKYDPKEKEKPNYLG